MGGWVTLGQGDGDGFGTHVGGVSAHVGDMSFFVELLGEFHGLGGGEAEAVGSGWVSGGGRGGGGGGHKEVLYVLIGWVGGWVGGRWVLLFW